MAAFNVKAFDRYLRAQQQKRAWKKSLRASATGRAEAAPVLAMPSAAGLAA